MINEGEQNIVSRILASKRVNPFVQNELKGKNIVSHSTNILQEAIDVLDNQTTIQQEPAVNIESPVVQPIQDINLLDPDIDSLEESAEISGFNVPSPLNIRKSKRVSRTKSSISEVKQVNKKMPIKKVIESKTRVKEDKFISINTDKYVAVHGHQPRGNYGMWMFKINGDEITFTGTYAVARDLAKDYAKRVGASVIYVLG